MDPILIYGAITANDQNRRKLTSTRHPSTRHPSRNVTSNSTRSWRPGAARMLRRLADRLEPGPGWKAETGRSVPAT
jgi:hypothetical protein